MLTAASEGKLTPHSADSARNRGKAFSPELGILLLLFRYISVKAEGDSVMLQLRLRQSGPRKILQEHQYYGLPAF